MIQCTTRSLSYFGMGGHSLLAAKLFAQIEKIVGKNLPLAILFKAPTIEQIAHTLRKKDWKPTWSSLVPIQTGGFIQPLFLIHGAEGNILLYRDLAHNLGKDQPVYGIQCEGLEGKKNFQSSFEEIAAHYIKEIRSLQPKGPYYLGGYCLGGIIAFEMAQQLHRQGQRVALLAMFETYNIKYSDKHLPDYLKIYHIIQDIKFHLENIFSLGSNDKFRFSIKKAQIAVSRHKVRLEIVISKAASKLQLGNGKKYHHVLVEKINDRAMFEYIPKVYPGPANPTQIPEIKKDEMHI